jgi:uncharacterized protein YecT (DUF1311 family)
MRNTHAQERPGEKEQADVDKANTRLDGGCRSLIAKAEPEEQTALKEAQRAWIKWRDVEAMSIAAAVEQSAAARCAWTMR